MSTATPPPLSVPPPAPLVLYDISWTFYQQFLTELGERHLSHSFNDGVLTIMSPGVRHERSKRWFTRFVDALTEELGLPCHSLGSMTMKLDPKQKGAEPDNCYLIANAHLLDGRREYDLSDDPPPDLVIEIDMTSPSLNRLPVYAALGVPEVWVYDGRGLTVKLLQPGDPATYADSKQSASFPAVPMPDVAAWIEKAYETDETTWIRNVRKWVRETLKP